MNDKILENKSNINSNIKRKPKPRQSVYSLYQINEFEKGTKQK